jgi:hypothetical protein
MNINERFDAIKAHLTTLETTAGSEFSGVDAVVHAELAKLEAALLNKIAMVKNAASSI